MGVFDLDYGRLWPDWLRMAVADDSLLDVLRHLQSARHEESLRNYERAEALDDPDYWDSVADEECQRSESLYGVAFVICQTYMDSVARRLEKIHEYSAHLLKSDKPAYREQAKRYHKALAKLPRQKNCMLQVGEHVSDTIPVFAAEAIHHVANYFKHQEEWPLRWSEVPKISQRTRDVIQQLGMKEPHGSFVDAAEAFGVQGHLELTKLEDAVRVWSELLLKKLTDELKNIQVAS